MLKKIAIIGLGYVGLPLAVEFGKKRSVLGFDINKRRVAELKSFKDVTLETSKADLLEAKGLVFSSNPEDLAEASIYIITVPTPIDSANRPDLSLIKLATESISNFIAKGDIVIYESTVFPGATDEICVPIIEKISNLTYNKDFFCGYSPERVNPGDKENTLTKIKKIVSGSNIEITNEINELYQSIIVAGTWVCSSIRVAEAAKVIENSQRDLNIAFVNELSLIFNRLGIDTTEVLEAAGSKWNFMPFRPGMVGGHCIGVDPYYLTHKAEESGYNPQVILAGRRINDNMGKYAARQVIQLMLQNSINPVDAKVGVLGITFKENCPDIRNSKVIDLVIELKNWNIDFLLDDPLANAEELNKQYNLKLTNIDKSSNLDVLIVAVSHKQYREKTLKELRSYCSNQPKPILADLKSIFQKDQSEREGFTVFRF